MRNIICKKETTEPVKKTQQTENTAETNISSSLNMSSITNFFSLRSDNTKKACEVGKTRYPKNIIAIEKGMEDKRSCVVLCKCGNYHQLPKWKQPIHSKVPEQRMDTAIRKGGKKKAILHPIVDQVEIAQDSLRGEVLPAITSNSCTGVKLPKFTKSRKSCQYFKLKFHGSCKTEDASAENGVARLKHSPSMKRRVV